MKTQAREDLSQGDGTAATYIFAGNFRQYTEWRRRSGASSGREPRFIPCADALRGLRGGRLILVGTWYEHPECAEVKEIAAYSGMLVLEQ